MEITWLGIVVIGILILTGVSGYRRGFIREIVSFFFVFLALALASVINPYVNDFLMTETAVYEKIQDSCMNVIEGKEDETEEEGEQSSLIENLGLPDMLSQSMEANNTSDVYSYLAVSTFGDYIVSYLARMIVNGISFLVSYLIATVVIRLGNYLLNLIAQLPLIKGANKISGALVGVLKGVLFVWLGFLVLTVLCNTQAGKMGLALIDQDIVLKNLYKYDVFVNFFMNIFYGA